MAPKSVSFGNSNITVSANNNIIVCKFHIQYIFTYLLTFSIVLSKKKQSINLFIFLVFSFYFYSTFSKKPKKLDKFLWNEHLTPW